MPTRRFALLLVAAIAVAGLARGSGPAGPLTSAKGRRLDSREAGERYDEPQEARDFYALKRAPVGRSTIPVERYRVARERMAGMARYSTRAGGFRGRGGLGAAAAQALGTWSPLGPGNIGGRTRALVIDPTTPTTMYAGGVAGGVWKTTNAGGAWTALGDELANLAVSTLALKPGSPNVILAGTGEGFFNLDAVRGAGIFRSTDAGVSFTQIEKPLAGTESEFHYVNKIVFSPSNPSVVFAATGKGVYRSTDSGVNWSRILNPTEGGLGGGTITGGCVDLAIRSDSPTLFASCGTFTQARVYRTTNATTGGTPSWSYSPTLDGTLSPNFLTETRMGRTSLAIAPSNQDVVYALASDNQSLGLWAVYRSGDGGLSWETRAPVNSLGFESALLLTNPPFAWPCFGGGAQFLNQGWYDNVIAVDPTDPDVVWTGGIDLFRSDNGGFDFGLASYWWGDSGPPNDAYAHADQHAIVFHPAYNGTTNQQMFVGNDGGVFRTANAKVPTTGLATGDDVCDPSKSSVVFASLNHGYGVTQFYYGAVYPDDRQFIGGTQDNGTIYGSESAGTEGWIELLGGDGGAVAVDPTDTDTLYAENTDVSIQKCTLGTSCVPNTSDWQDKVSGISDGGFLFIAPFVMDPSDHLRLFTGGTYLWRTSNGADAWQRASSAMSSSVSAIAIAPSNREYALVGTRTGFIHRSSSASTTGSGTAWAKVQPRTGYVSSVTFDPYDPNVGYATYSTFNGSDTGPAHVFKTTDAGATWTGLPGTGANKLPNLPVHSIVVDPTQVGRLYVGTDLGVFVTVDGGLNWAQENTQFPGTVTEQLVVNGANVYAFTHGRGVFRVPLTSAAGQTVRLDMVATTSSKPESGAGPATVQFKVRTSNHANVSGAAPTVHVTTADGTATAGTDYTAQDTDFVIPVGTVDGATVQLTVPLLNDTLGEPAETFTVNFATPSAGLVLSRTTHTVTITNDGDPVGIKVLDLSLTEGNGPGTTNAEVTVQLSFPVDSTPVQVTATTAPGSASSPGDYQHRVETLTFSVGQGIRTFLVPIVGDTIAEPAKSFLVNLSSPSANGVIDDAQAVVTINDNDVSGTMQLAAPRYTVSEAGTKALITVSRVGGVASGVGFDLVTQDGTAVSTGSADFTAVGPGPFFFSAGATTRTIEVPIVNDTNDEADETFLLRLSNPTGFAVALGQQQTALVTITDNDTAGALQFSASTHTAAESAGTATLTVTRTGGNTGPLTVDVQVLPASTATSGVDFSLATTQLTFGVNQTSAPLTVNLTDDSDPEGNETVNLGLANATNGATIGAKNTAVLTITDSEPTLFFSAPTFSVSEAAKSAVITVKRAGPLTDTVTVNYATSAGSAQPGQDYTDVAGTLTFLPNATMKTFTVPLIGDFVVDGTPTETINLNLSGAAGGTPPVQLGLLAAAVLTITENDAGGAVAFGATSYTMTEPKTTAPALLKVTIKRTGGTAQGATMLLSTVNGVGPGGAVAGADFTMVSNKPVVFAAGKTIVTETIEILPDIDPEGPESFTLTLTSPSGGATPGTPTTATVKIVDNEPVVEWSAATFAGKEPAGDTPITSTAFLTIKRTGSTLGDATVNVRATGGSAVQGVIGDYQFSPNPRTVVLPSGKAAVTVPITLNADSSDDGLETVTFALESPVNAALGTLVNTTLNITDEEPVVQFSLATYTVNEPSTGANAVITVKRLGNLNLGTTVNYTTSDFTAFAGQDYDTMSGVLTFLAKASSRTFTVPIRADVDDEVDEVFRVTLSGPVGGGSLGSPVQADVKIKDNDTAGKLQLQISVLSVSESEGSAALTVTRTGGTGAATVDYATTGGSASSGTDFAMTVGTLPFGAGETSKTIVIPITDDGFDEDGEFFTLTLSNPGGGATLGTPVQATVWIVDNE